MSDRAMITDEELHAFIDGELDPLRAADVAVLVQYHAELQQRIDAFRVDKAMLSTVYGPLIDRPLPANWHGLIARGRRPAGVQISRRTVFAAAASTAAAFIGWRAYLRIKSGDEDIAIAEAMNARNEAYATSLSTFPDRVQVDQALKTALGLQIKTPDMSKLGFTLTNFRVYNDASGGKALKLDYRDEQSRLFTLYLRRSPGEEHFDMLKRGAVRVCVWQDEVLSAVMLAEVPAGEMLRLATLAYAGLSA